MLRRGVGGGGEVVPTVFSPSVPQGRDVGRPGTASPCRTGAIRCSPTWRRSASSSTSTACRSLSGGTPEAGTAPRVPSAPQLTAPFLRREKYWQLMEAGGAHDGPRGCGEGRGGGEDRGRDPPAPHPHQRRCVWGLLPAPEGSHCPTTPLPPTPGPPLPLVLQRLFEALQDLERCHRQLPPAAPAPLELQT